MYKRHDKHDLTYEISVSEPSIIRRELIEAVRDDYGKARRGCDECRAGFGGGHARKKRAGGRHVAGRQLVVGSNSRGVPVDPEAIPGML